MGSDQQNAAQRVAELRKEFFKQTNNPYRHMTAEGGHHFDPAMYRFQAMRVSHYDHFKPTYKSFKTGFFCVVFPIVFFALAFKWQRDGNEEKFRTGQVAYKDRWFKFI